MTSRDTSSDDVTNDAIPYDAIAAGYNELHGAEQATKAAIIASHLRVLRPHTSIHTAGGIPVKHVKFNEIYPAISEQGIVIIGAENYWRMAGERKHG